MYWIYRTRTHLWRNRLVEARLIEPEPRLLRQAYSSATFRSPTQMDPYGVDLHLTYQVRTQAPHPDLYPEWTGFSVCSHRLIRLMKEFGVYHESFPITMVDQHGNVQSQLDYGVFHCLEGVLPAMDEEGSEWSGADDIGIPRLLLDLAAFEHRPMFYCNHVFVPLMHDDLKQAIERVGITGIGFLRPENYISGRYGIAPAYEE